MGIVGHKVLDVPKKHTAKQVLELANGFMKELILQSVERRKPKRCTEITGAQLKMKLPPIPKCKAFSECEQFLRSQCTGISFGQLHFPMEEVVLGREAGKAIMEQILQTPRQEKCYHRDVHVSLLGEIAKVIDHKLFRKIGSCPRDWLSVDANEIKKALKCRSRAIIELMALYNSRL